MNGVPLKFDFSKTLNEQLPTFNYYKGRYLSHVTQLIELIDEKNRVITFLKDKIKECFDIREKLAENLGYGDEYEFGQNMIKLTSKLQIYQEVLDFVEKGGKDE